MCEPSDDDYIGNRMSRCWLGTDGRGVDFSLSATLRVNADDVFFSTPRRRQHGRHAGRLDRPARGPPLIGSAVGVAYTTSHTPVIGKFLENASSCNSSQCLRHVAWTAL